MMIDNRKKMMNKTKALTGTYTLTTNKQIYNLEFNAITNEKRIDWNLYAKTTIQDKAISVYLKEQKLYIIYRLMNLGMKEKLLIYLKSY